MHVLLRTSLEMPMRSRVERLYADYRQAAGLLRHDLVWSSDFEAIRLDLSTLILNASVSGSYSPELTSIVHNLIATENDLSI